MTNTNDLTPKTVCAECLKKTKIGYDDGGRFFMPHFKSINHVEAVSYTHLYALIVNWNEHVHNTLRPLQESYHIGLETGAIEFACINTNIYCIHALSLIHI